MARHDIPQDGVKHIPAPDCPCQPAARKALDRGVRRTVYAHQAARKHPEMPARCGCTVVAVDGDDQHHTIPDDGTPHAPTSECGCDPQRRTVAGHVVYEHVDYEGGDHDGTG